MWPPDYTDKTRGRAWEALLLTNDKFNYIIYKHRQWTACLNPATGYSGVSFRRNAMKKLEEGLYEVEEPMPCRPRDVPMMRYAVPSLGRQEQEEAAARLLIVSREMGKWVGVSWKYLVLQMQKEWEADKAARDAQQRNLELDGEYWRQMKIYHKKVFSTFGFGWFFLQKPVPPQHESVPEVQPIMSMVWIAGPKHVLGGMQELVERKLIKVVEMGEDDIIFPTRHLIEAIMQKRQPAV